jgi:hypothetical protein
MSHEEAQCHTPELQNMESTHVGDNESVIMVRQIFCPLDMNVLEDAQAMKMSSV